MKSFHAEMMEKAKTVEERLAIAKENNIAMTADEAAAYLAQQNPESCELSDDLLEGVSGGLVQLVNPSSARP